MGRQKTVRRFIPSPHTNDAMSIKLLSSLHHFHSFQYTIQTAEKRPRQAAPLSQMFVHVHHAPFIEHKTTSTTMSKHPTK
jgi:hypothetical protein